MSLTPENNYNQIQTPHTRIPLRQMQKNQSGTIAEVRSGGELGLRLREMGLIPGTRVTVQGRAPLYDPVALRIMGCTLTLRNNEADCIAVDID
jgi:ferrous iron transport protein A